MLIIESMVHPTLATLGGGNMPTRPYLLQTAALANL
jgi:hypothetical protein